MKKILFALTLFFISVGTQAQTPKVEWATAIGGTGNDRANSIATDTKGNIIVVGRFRSPVIKSDKITLTKTLTDSDEDADIFIIKLDKNGKTLWAVTAGDKGDDHALSCVTDKKGNSYVVGYFESKFLKFGNTTLTKKSEKGSDLYVAKFSANGTCLWANNAGGEGANGEYSTIALDKQNNIVVAGIAGTTMDFGNGAKLSHEKSGIYVAKYTNNGQLLWAKSPVGKGEAQGVATDLDGNIFIGGFFITTISFDDISLQSHTEKSGDAFVAKYSPTGTAIWARNFGGDGGEIASCETDLFGNVYLGGIYFSKTIVTENTTLTNNGLTNAFITKYDNSGKLMWTKSAGGNNGEKPAIATREFYVDDNGNPFCTGSNWSEFTFAGKSIKPVAGSEDVFLLKYDKDGNELWGVDYGGTGRNAGRGITTDKKGNVFLTGSFDEKNLKLDNHTLINEGDSDIFIIKFIAQKK